MTNWIKFIGAKTARFSLALFAVTFLVFSGWLRIGNLTFDVLSAEAAISFVSCGTAVAVDKNNMASVGIPAGIANNDILITYVHTRDNIDSTMPADWTNNVSGNDGTNNRLEIFWKRTAGTELAPTVTRSGGNSGIARMCAFRGIDTAGDPFNVVGAVQSNAGSPISTAAITTTVDGAMVLHAFGSQDNNTWGSYTGLSTTEAAQDANALGGDNSSALTYGLQSSAGGTGAAGATQTALGPDAGASVQLALRPLPITTIGNGTNPSNITIAPGASATDLDSFTLQTTFGSDTVTGATVSLAAGSSGGLSSIAITSDNGSTTYCSQADPASDTVSLASCNIPVSASSVPFKIRITPKSHANMPAPPGSSQAVTGTVTSFTGTNAQTGTDMNSATITIDNQSPASVTYASGTAGNQQVSLSWTNPADSDLHSMVVLRRASSAVTDTPSEGTTYTIGNTIGSSIVACVESSPSTSCSDTGLTNGTAYYYKIFSRDTSVNYDTGAVPTGSPFTPAVPADTTAPAAVADLAASNPGQSSVQLSWIAPGDDNNSGTATTYDVRYSTANITDANWSSATQASGEPTPSTAGSAESMTVTGLSSNTTYYFVMKTSDEVLNTSALSNVASGATSAETAAPSAAPAAGGVAPRRATFSGYAYPGSTIEIFRKSITDELYKQTPAESSEINADGSFVVNYTGLLGADYLFALQVKDKDGRSTGILAYNVSFFGDVFEVRNILAPPTIGFEKSLIAKNERAKIMGYAIPLSVVELEIDGSVRQKTTANQSGFWNFDVDTVNLEYGDHSARVHQTTPAKISNFSLSRTFKLSSLAFPRADLNGDGVVNVSDWSIFLYRWGSDDAKLREQNDLNQDGELNVSDFSIFLAAIKI